MVLQVKKQSINQNEKRKHKNDVKIYETLTSLGHSCIISTRLDTLRWQ